MNELEASAQDWQGGIDWRQQGQIYYRHWWRIDVSENRAVHRSSGESVSYLGKLDGNNWHRFEYRDGQATYSIAVQFKQVAHPNPDPDRYAGPPYNAGSQPELGLRIWCVDYLRSAELQRHNDTTLTGTAVQPPFELWKRVDNAITEAGLLWPKLRSGSVAGCDEVVIRGGWLNGRWRNDYYRRLRQDEDWKLATGARRSKSATSILRIGLPLTDYSHHANQATSSKWRCEFGPGLDRFGRLQTRRTATMREVETDTLIAVAADQNLPHTGVTPLLVIKRDEISFAVLVKPNTRDLPIESGQIGGDLRACYSWEVVLSGWCTTASGRPQTEVVPWLGKPVASLDSIGPADLQVVRYSSREINHVLSSYQSWRWAYDSFLGALPCSPGFFETACKSEVEQGAIGQVVIRGGFVGGIQSLVTEIRFNLELPSDRPNAGWSKFFSMEV